MGSVGLPTFEQAVRETYSNQEFMREYRRLKPGCKLGLSDTRKPIERMIDEACGRPAPEAPTNDEWFEFFNFVRDYVWMPVIAKLMEEAKCS